MRHEPIQFPHDLAREEKSSWRKHLSRQCASIPVETARQAAAAMCRRVLALPEVTSASGLLVCLSFGHEIDTWNLIAQLLDGGKKVVVPRTRRATRQLSLHPYPCRLETTGFGLRQPVRRAPRLEPAAIDSTIEVALLLGIGFDHRGVRLGYGAGYFDRFLSRRPFPAIGLAYECQVVDRLPHEPHDLPMVAVVTERATRRQLDRAPSSGIGPERLETDHRFGQLGEPTEPTEQSVTDMETSAQGEIGRGE